LDTDLTDFTDLAPSKSKHCQIDVGQNTFVKNISSPLFAVYLIVNCLLKMNFSCISPGLLLVLYELICHFLELSAGSVNQQHPVRASEISGTQVHIYRPTTQRKLLPLQCLSAELKSQHAGNRK